MAKKPTPVSDLLTMTKDGVEILVHPTQVALWETQGWTVEGANE